MHLEMLHQGLVFLVFRVRPPEFDRGFALEPRVPPSRAPLALTPVHREESTLVLLGWNPSRLNQTDANY